MSIALENERFIILSFPISTNCGEDIVEYKEMRQITYSI